MKGKDTGLELGVLGNRISVADFEVSSTTSNLREVEDTINRLITKHSDFVRFRKQRRFLEHSGIVK